MPSNKDRMYVVLNARRGKSFMPDREDSYHWSLIVGPKYEHENSTGFCYHANEYPKVGGGSEWYFEEIECPLTHNSILVRIVIGKVLDPYHTAEIMRNTPVRQGRPGWNCVAWVKEALETLQADNKALGTSMLEWSIVRNIAMAYCQRKQEQHRFDGRGNFDMKRAPTYDLLEQRETVA
ncbi:hypothetical protein N7491_009355 [Penicillium cf. griseofulvum]|uniref:Uncharacterized protein n=1 Tax=Penicillium cf. griseofulvum TaxID=2972120 RepID=A0A9W9JMS8_9EURO|nr:hypothetical protein N7472_005052 [Penicillium cf. griseofulvum]KAJ5424139.1 hypothetical protein N7491_009355 [Penicillium cf. griseofulvum]KAJ5442621.1 hypothetical protein N7445_005628 [Penicillium cf. griseofulvum]